MQVLLDHVGTVFGGSFDLPAGTVAMTRIATTAGTRIAVTDYSFGTTQILDLNGSGLPQVVQTDWHVTGRTAVSMGATGGSLADITVQMAGQAQVQGVLDAQTVYLGATAQQTQAASLLMVDTGGSQMAYVAASNGTGLACFGMGGSGEMALMHTVDDNNTSYMSKVTDLAHVQVGTSQFLYAASAGDHGIAGYRIYADGHLSAVTQLGRDQSLPVQTVTTLETAKIAGQDYLIAGASGSSSLSVMAVDASGALTVTDHLIDSLSTRFYGVGQMDVVTVGDFVFVLAAGMDDGLSLFTLTPNGQLVHLDSLPDSLTAALDGVSGLAAQEVDGGIEIVTTAAGEAGLSLFRVDLSDLGAVMSQSSGAITGTGGDDMLSLSIEAGAGNGALDGGAGDDILSDGAGRDTMTGGDGADTFLLAADGQRDVITDVQVGVDRLDLSLWGRLYSANQIVVESTTWGAVLRFGGEVLELHSFDNMSLDAQDVTALLPEMLSRVAVVTAPLQEADSNPFPDPDPDPNPGPPVAGIRLNGTEGDDILQGGAGNDGLKGLSGNDLIYGGAGDDRLPGAGGNDTIYGGDGNDRLGGGDGDDYLDGGAGNDRGGAGAGNDTIRGGAGDDVFSGGADTDDIDLGDGNDRGAGSYGHDVVRGGAGNDTLGGGLGNDTMYGGEGDDRIGAGDWNDTVYGEEGDDFLGGGEGDDRIEGGTGRDTLNGGHGDDTLLGGAGSDVFVFNARSASGTDVIRDFEDGSDLMRLVGRALPANDPLSRVDISDSSFEGETAARVIYGDHTIYVLGISAADLTEGDFLFT